MKDKYIGYFRRNLTKRCLPVLFALVCAVNLLGVNDAVSETQLASQAGNPVIFSFAFFGCNRLDKAGAKATESASTANVAQLRQSFQDIADSARLPNYVFLGGDIVKAKKPGKKKLSRQLRAWVALVNDPGQNPLLKKNVPLVAFTGNHELLINQKDGDNCQYAQCPNPPAYRYWQKYMGQKSFKFILGKNGPKPGGKDGLLGNERKLSYSFRSKDVKFVILNTDTRIDKDTIGDVPLHWLQKQLRSAQRDNSIHHVFVMGHKPLQSAKNASSDPSGNRTIRAQQAEAFYTMLNDPAGDGSPSKVRVYLAAHAHEWNYTPKLTVGKLSGNVAQIIAGNGGSPPNSAWTGKNAYFGYTLVEISQSGTVTAKSYGRPINTPYYDQKVGVATLRESEVLYAPAQLVH